MFKLIATIQKDTRLLLRDKVGLLFMFIMPIILAVVITAIQNNTFKLVNDNKVPLLLSNRDSGHASADLVKAIGKAGMFQLTVVDEKVSDKELTERMQRKDALVALVIP